MAVIDPVSAKPFKSDNRGLLQLFKLTVKSLNPRAADDMMMIEILLR